MECAIWEWIDGCTDLTNSFSLIIEIFAGAGIAVFFFNRERKRKQRRTTAFMNTLIETLMPFQLDLRNLREEIFDAGGGDQYDKNIEFSKWNDLEQKWTNIQSYREKIDIRISGSGDNIDEKDLIDLQNISMSLKEPLTLGQQDSLNRQMNAVGYLDIILLRSGTLLNKYKKKIKQELKRKDAYIDEKIWKLCATNAPDSQVRVIKFWEERKASNRKKVNKILDMDFDS